MKPFWFPATSGKDHVATGYASQWLWESEIATLCGRHLDDTSGPLSGDRCAGCVGGLRSLLGGTA